MDAAPLNLVRPEVPVELAALVAKMMAKEPDQRFQTPGEVAQALSPFFKAAASPTAAPSGEWSRSDYPIQPDRKTTDAGPAADSLGPSGTLIETQEDEPFTRDEIPTGRAKTLAPAGARARGDARRAAAVVLAVDGRRGARDARAGRYIRCRLAQTGSGWAGGSPGIHAHRGEGAEAGRDAHGLREASRLDLDPRHVIRPILSRGK